MFSNIWVVRGGVGNLLLVRLFSYGFIWIVVIFFYVYDIFVFFFGYFKKVVKIEVFLGDYIRFVVLNEDVCVCDKVE